MFYKVPFAAVPDLVGRRQVLLRGGYAYVREAQVRDRACLLSVCLFVGVLLWQLSMQCCALTAARRCSIVCCQVGSLVVGCFRMHLSASLTEAAWAWGNFTAVEADRLAPLVDNLPNR